MFSLEEGREYILRKSTDATKLGEWLLPRAQCCHLVRSGQAGELGGGQHSEVHKVK